MKRVAVSLLTLVLCGTAIVPATIAGNGVVGQVPDRIVITMKPDHLPEVARTKDGVSVSIASLDALAQRFAIKDMAPLHDGVAAPTKQGAPDLRLVWTVDFPAEYGLQNVRAAYAALPEVELAEVVDICQMHALPNDPGIVSQQWHLRNLVPGGGDIRALGGWAEAVGNPNIIIAIADSGVDWMHPDLGGSPPNYLDGNIWINWDEWLGDPGEDDDFNGKIDDFRGWDFVTGVTGPPDEDTSIPDNDPMDYESHGTHVAGCASPITDNGIGIAGAAWNCKIMALRIGWLPLDSELGVVRMDFAAQAMVYATAKGAKIFNCSWGSSNSGGLGSAVTNAIASGMIVVTSAGNDNEDIPSYLGSRSDVVAVAATNSGDGKADFSDYGEWVDISAPGVSIYSTFWNQGSQSHTYATLSGTSMSSPVACGAIGLLWSAHPEFTRDEVLSLLYSSADNIDAENPGQEGLLGAGRINLLKALGDSFQKVPAEFPTLLDAMNEAAPGDTIAVSSNTAISGLQVILPKEMTILGGWNDTFTSRDPVDNPTVISALVIQPAMQFQGGTTPATVIDGFRLTGGGGQFFSDIPYAARYGGGLLLNGVSPTLRNIEVVGNGVGNDGTLGCGGGIAMNNSNSVLENVRVHGNSAIYGAGVFIYRGSPTLIGCEIYDNISIENNDDFDGTGGGLHILDADVTLQQCTISGHTTVGKGAGIYAANLAATTNLLLSDTDILTNFSQDSGGGLYMAGTDLAMTRCRIQDNGATPEAAFMRGGGFYILGSSAAMDSVTCLDNTCQIGAGGIISNAAVASVTNSVFAGNNASFSVGGLSFDGVLDGTLSGSTFAGNNSTQVGGGGVLLQNSTTVVTANIFAFNTGATTTFANGVHISGGAATLGCNDGFGNDGSDFGGIGDPVGTDGNISADPLFCDVATGNLAIASNSPCAPANSGGCGLIGALAAGCTATAVEDDPLGVPRIFRVEQNFPNPFNPQTKIRFALPARAFTTLKIFDVAGRLVRTLLAEELPAAEYEQAWTGQDDGGRGVAAGVYFYQVNSGKHSFTGRMALVK